VISLLDSQSETGNISLDEIGHGRMKIKTFLLLSMGMFMSATLFVIILSVS